MYTEPTESETRTHVLTGFANPYLVCDQCNKRAVYWHNPERCTCSGKIYNHPCGHPAGVTSICDTWNSVKGCQCENKETHDKQS